MILSGGALAKVAIELLLRCADTLKIRVATHYEALFTLPIR